MKRTIALGALVLANSALAAGGSVSGSKHDFSVTGPGQVRASGESDPCIFCHIAHRAGDRVLSNRPDTSARHVPYESSTMAAERSMPSGASRICLSCHDGTIAVGRTRNRSIPMVGGAGHIPSSSRANLGTDLRGTHPVSIATIPSATLHTPPIGDAVRLDETGKVQCTSCHDPHQEFRDPTVGKFLVKRADGSALCTSCHSAGGADGDRATHLRKPQGGTRASLAGTTPSLPSGCDACHTQHAADKRGRLLKADRPSDALCLGCHGDDSERPIKPDLAKASTHGGDPSQRHDAGEGPDAHSSKRLPEESIGSPRHSTCVDCHDPHASTTAPAVAPRGGGALVGVWGIGIDGKRVAKARYEYEICLKCHGDSANKPQAREGFRADGVRRARTDANLREVFSASAVSFHPVAQPGRTAVVPSLKSPLTTGSQILCTDCHNSDSARSAGGAGSNGPHGSIYPYLLERQYVVRDQTPESADAYALCYKCHDRALLLSASSSFPLHESHVKRYSTPCSACHAAHGVSAEANPERTGHHLVSFDLSIVQRSRTGSLAYASGATARGSCALSCHGQEHGPGEKAKTSGLEAWSY